jgi:hypothetical protein
MHYGTQAQKDFWLPGLANGKETLLRPDRAGSGLRCGRHPDKDRLQGMHKGEEVLGIAQLEQALHHPGAACHRAGAGVQAL